MNKFRIILLVLILSISSYLSYLLYKDHKTPKFEITFAPFFQVLGKPTSTMSRVLTKVIPIDAIDEKEYGEAIAERYSYTNDKENKDFIYVNSLMKEISKFAKKPFEYRVFIMDSYSPNAFAMPGGVIFVTTGLLNTLETEAQLIAVLSHELGHVEKSHCLDHVRFELLAKKVGTETLGKLADFAFNILISHSYGKTQENEADEYAFDLILRTSYTPRGESQAFQKLIDAYNDYSTKETRRGNVLKEYFQSHPHLEHRRDKFNEKADSFFNDNPEEKKYNGKLNLTNRIPFYSEQYEEEWGFY